MPGQLLSPFKLLLSWRADIFLFSPMRMTFYCHCTIQNELFPFYCYLKNPILGCHISYVLFTTIFHPATESYRIPPTWRPFLIQVSWLSEWLDMDTPFSFSLYLVLYTIYKTKRAKNEGSSQRSILPNSLFFFDLLLTLAHFHFSFANNSTC